MRFGSIGTRAASRSTRAEASNGRAERRSGGFTLIEALVALALVLAFAAALTPHLFQSRRIVADADDEPVGGRGQALPDALDELSLGEVRDGHFA